MTRLGINLNAEVKLSKLVGQLSDELQRSLPQKISCTFDPGKLGSTACYNKFNSPSSQCIPKYSYLVVQDHRLL